MFEVQSFRDSELAVTQTLERLGVKDQLTGGVAVIAYGEPRMTQDFDLLVLATSCCRVSQRFGPP